MSMMIGVASFIESSLKSFRDFHVFKWIFMYSCFSVLCCLIVPIESSPLSSIYNMNKTNTTLSQLSHSVGNDYNNLSSNDYYKQLSGIHQFTQMHNLRLDSFLSPKFHPTNGESIMYLRTQNHIPDVNDSITTTLHWVDIKTNRTIQLTRPKWGIHDYEFFWIEDKIVLFLSNRGKSGLKQLFQLNLPDDVSTNTGFIEPVQITDFPRDIYNLLVNRQGTRLAFSCEVYANLSIEETAAYVAADRASKGFVHKFDKLFIRHWDQYRRWNEYMLGLRHHPFLVQIKKNANGIYNFTDTPRDLLFGIDSDSPMRIFGSAATQWSFSASGNKFAFARRYDETSEVAWTYNADIFTVDLNVPDSKPVCITKENLAVDTGPKYSPTDENVLVYRAQRKPRYKSDQFKIKLYNGSAMITLLDNWDRSINAITWSSDGQALFLELGEEARGVIYKMSNIFSRTPTLDRLIHTGSSIGINVHPTNNDMFVFHHSSLTKPSNIYLFSCQEMKPITNHNRYWMDKVQISNIVEMFNFTGALNETVWGWHVAPINGTDKKAPLVFLIHNGPQSAYYDEWLRASNFHFFASEGYAVIAINFHGSTSYGQKFTDSVIGEYGSLPFEDLKLGLTAALTRYPYIDGNRAIAFGTCYGGYMVNWIAGHPEMSHRFKALISQGGIFNLKDFAYSTDELSIVETDVGGFTLYENPEAFERFNPMNHVANWSQPMLIIHGNRDFRVPSTQGISAFTALQRRGIPSRLILSLLEGHEMTFQSTSIIVHRAILDWMKKWTA